MVEKCIKDTIEHCKRVAYLSKKIARSIAPEKEGIAYIAGLWHDSGKLNKNIIHLISEERPLTDKEREVIKPHALLSARFYMSNHIKPNNEVVNAIIKHHNPDDILSRIIYISDFYDALTTRPNYNHERGPLNSNKALEIIYERIQNLQISFDPKILNDHNRLFIV